MSLPARFWTRVVAQLDGCWRWTGVHGRDGYGHFRISGVGATRAHRIVYEELIGPIPADLVTDHLCRVRDCVNPTHIELVTRRENTLRGNAPAAVQARKTHCDNGHPLEKVHPRYRGCRICIRAQGRVRYRQRHPLSELKHRRYTEEDVARAREAFAVSGTYTAVGKGLGIHPATVRRLVLKGAHA